MQSPATNTDKDTYELSVTSEPSVCVEGGVSRLVENSTIFFFNPSQWGEQKNLFLREGLKKKIVEFSTTVGRVSAWFSTKKKKHGFKTLDFTYRSF